MKDDCAPTEEEKQIAQGIVKMRLLWETVALLLAKHRLDIEHRCRGYPEDERTL